MTRKKKKKIGIGILLIGVLLWNLGFIADIIF